MNQVEILNLQSQATGEINPAFDVNVARLTRGFIEAGALCTVSYGRLGLAGGRVN